MADIPIKDMSPIETTNVVYTLDTERTKKEIEQLKEYSIKISQTLVRWSRSILDGLEDQEKSFARSRKI